MKRNLLSLILAGLTAVSLSACDNEGDDRMLEKARLEGREQAKGELEAQLEAKDKMVERARQEGRAQAEAELKVQLENRDALIRKARDEGRAVAEQELQAQNEMLTKRAKAMEKDLSQRQRFYQSLSGVYEGDLATEEGAYRVKITLVPSISPYSVDRTRMPEEIAQDLNALSFSAQVVEWNPASSKSGVGCRIEGIRPNLTNGTITIAKETCGSVYALSISDSKAAKVDAKGNVVSAAERSRKMAASILSGKTSVVPEISGVKRPTTNAQEYNFALRKRD